MQFQKESTIITKVQNQNTIEEAHSCLVKTILQAAQKTIPKTPSETKRRPNRPVALTNILCKIFERMTNKRLVWYLEKEKKIAG